VLRQRNPAGNWLFYGRRNSQILKKVKKSTAGTSNTVTHIRPSLAIAASDWFRTDGLGWIYVLKASLAAISGLWIAIRLGLPSPRTAMTTVFIVMQPESGMVLSKSLYRLGGTVIGLVAMMVFIGLFAQTPDLFLTATGVWVAICTIGASHNRNFRSYGFVLAGYTAVLVGIPAVLHPQESFLSATTRLGEVVIGVICAGAVSALVLPRHAKVRLLPIARQHFSDFFALLDKAKQEKLDQEYIENAHLNFVSSIVRLESTREFAALEDPEARMRAGRLARLNEEFAHVLTRQHMLHRFVGRLAKSTQAPHSNEVLSLYGALLRSLPLDPDSTASQSNIDYARAHVSACRHQWRTSAIEARRRLIASDNASLIDLETCIELTERFLEDFNSYLLTYQSLDFRTNQRERWKSSYRPKTNFWLAAISGLRAAVVMALLSVFWIASSWPSGAMAVLNGATICALTASMARPAKVAYQMTAGTALACFAGYFEIFKIFPLIDGFPLLALSLLPFIAFGAFLTIRQKWAGYGVGFGIYFCFLAGPENFVRYDPTGYINDSLAVVVSMFVTALAFAVIFPPGGAWHRKLLMFDLRLQAVLACRRKWYSQDKGFESAVRDFLLQLLSLQNTVADRRSAFAWFFSTLEIGRAAVDTRELLRRPQRGDFSRCSDTVKTSVSKMLDALATAFGRPTSRSFDRAVNATSTCIKTIARESEIMRSSGGDIAHMSRLLAQAHFIRSALLDDRCPLKHS
jgi:uncharacterized membrane protein YccC